MTLIFLSTKAYGQEISNATHVSDTLVYDQVGLVENYFKHRHFAVLSIGSLFNTTPGIQLGYEYLLTNEFGLLGETGYLINSAENRQGMRFKVEGRFYLKNKIFVGLEYVYRQTVTQVTDWIDVGSHDRLFTFRGIKSLSYFGPKFGVIIPLDYEGRFFFELASTVGLTKYKVTNKDLPAEYSPSGSTGGFLGTILFLNEKLLFQ